ncbi:MAG: sialidase family protein, partial [candidate division WOR-3 bacterium]
MKKIMILNLLISTLYSQIIWGPEKRINPDSIFPMHPRAAVWKDTIHVVFYKSGGTPSEYDIIYMRSTDKGETWEGPINLTINDPDDAVLPWITCWGKKVHVVYQCGYGDSVMYIRSLDGGNNWEVPKKLIKPAGLPKIVCIKDTIFVISPAPGFNNKFYFLRSFNGGDTWVTEIIDSVYYGKPRLGLNKNFLHIIFEQVDTKTEVYYRRSPDLGNTWEGPFLISPLDNWSSVLPSLAVSDSNVYILWMEGMYCSFGAWFNVNLRKSNDNGNNFSDRQILSNLCRSFENDIYARDSIVVIVYTDERHNPGQSDFEIYWRASYDYGNTWTDEERLSFITGNSMWP